MSVDKIFVATKAFIDYHDRILILKESKEYSDGTNEGSYDVPGGRVEPGQRFDKNLLREIEEETGLAVKIERPFYVGEWRPRVKGENWQIVGTFFKCKAKNDRVILGDDHSEHIWINPNEYNNYSIIDNLKDAFEAYLRLKK
jgi:8-oxo-dGTP diphosphatase